MKWYGWIGPRVVGGRYYSGYWRETYTVVEITGAIMTVVWQDGHRTEHATPWDNNADKVMSDPFAYSK